MTVKEWLNRGYKIDGEINALLREQERAMTLATKSTTTTDGDRVQTSKVNTTEARFIRYADYTALIDKRIDELYAIKQEILTAINRVDDSGLRQLLIYRYIEFMSWEDIAYRLCYSQRQVLRMHGEALLKLKDVTKCH